MAKERVSFNCPYCNRKILTKRLKLNGVRTGPKLHSPFGQAYGQKERAELGVASYHFIDEKNIYISYDRKGFLRLNIRLIKLILPFMVCGKMR